MVLSKAKELRTLSDDELSTEIANIKRELFDLRFQQATRQMETGFHQFKHARRKLAQLMTIERERQLIAGVANEEAAVSSEQ
ncbi:50S ribosomal protein L29 [Leptolyngbya cf. ectocarpi LEGE 11479]|uniref:Large ribosomal subunit protein uL29 n=1 Tax=Leptolyngbya cf. ectocarpi LEGE 11479 TaxID=1828722 RepID=A0A928X203_LEPEC|nr:50S ribosomal protein L29 [Leptolyngbya ectocarpi]MBE9065048.1 50S ribosomal protein L29 [Leptolyngbya cf. ectocarpi LEGE 11479]